MGIRIVGHSYRLGSYRESNEELCLNLDVDAEWIVQKTGIKQRYLVNSNEGASDLAHEVADKALLPPPVAAAAAAAGALLLSAAVVVVVL